MAEERVQRRLAAILAADVVGYSRLMGADEAGTRARFNAHLHELIEPAIACRSGRIVNTTGDGLLVEFASVVDAVQCAVEIQTGMADRNIDEPDDQRIEFRIGVNLGDVIIEGDDIHGDGVNIAARLEGFAEPGGLCVSGKVVEEVRNKLEVSFEDMGAQEVKNIAEPVRTYCVRIDGGVSMMASAKPDNGHPLPLPDKPSIAVLAFENMSNDPEQEYFSDGISEDIITELCKISGLFVIARNSSFVYKGKPVSVKQVGQELGVRYVLEGSVRKAGNRLRITAQLIDSETDNHLWAERYDRDLEDIFALQDEITEKIVAALEVRLTAGEQKQVATRYTENLEAYDYFLRGRAYQLGDTKETNALALKMAERAIRLDPGFAGAYALLSLTHYRGWRRGWREDPKTSEQAFEAAKKAVALDDSLALAHTCLAWVSLFRKQYENAIAEGRRAISLDPNFAESYARLGLILTLAGEPEKAVDLVKKAMRLDPLYPANYYIYLGTAYYALGKYDEAIATCKECLTRSSDIMGCNLVLAVIHSESGRNEEAQAEVAEVLRLSPRASIERLRERVPFKDPSLLQRYLEGLRKAGLPEK
ncbi:MAG: adenylate cyclase [Alphaproteobacteria bacterium]